MWRSSSSTQSDVPEGIYTELCSKFFEIFLLMSRYDDNKYSTSVSTSVFIAQIEKDLIPMIGKKLKKLVFPRNPRIAVISGDVRGN